MCCEYSGERTWSCIDCYHVHTFPYACSHSIKVNQKALFHHSAYGLRGWMWRGERGDRKQLHSCKIHRMPNSTQEKKNKQIRERRQDRSGVRYDVKRRGQSRPSRHRASEPRPPRQPRTNHAGLWERLFQAKEKQLENMEAGGCLEAWGTASKTSAAGAEWVRDGEAEEVREGTGTGVTGGWCPW